MYITDTQLAADDGASLVGFIQAETDAVARTVEAKLRESVSVLDFGADPTGLSDSSAAFAAAIATDRPVAVPDGLYSVTDLTMSTDYQCLIGLGSPIVQKSDDGSLLTLAGRGQLVWGIFFEGKSGDFSGDNILVTGPEVQFHGCSSQHARAKAVKATGGATQIFGGIWTTSTSADFDMEFSGTGNIYNSVFGTKSTQSVGGTLVDEADVAFINAQMGKLEVRAGSGAKFSLCRINGDTTVNSSNVYFAGGNTFAGHVTIGDGSGGNISQIMFGPTNVVASGKTMTINSEVVDSTFHLGQVASSGATLSIASTARPNNDIWSPRATITGLSLGATGGSPTIGSGTISASVIQAGRRLIWDVSLVGASDTNYGSGAFFVRLPYSAARNARQSAILTDNGVADYVAIASISSTDDRVFFTVIGASGAAAAGASYPFTWGNLDRLSFDLTT